MTGTFGRYDALECLSAMIRLGFFEGVLVSHRHVVFVRFARSGGDFGVLADGPGIGR